jgi:hypothetical protein
MARAKTALAWVSISVLLVLVLGTVLFFLHPMLLTGRYYEITIRTVEHGPQGLVTLTYDEALSYGTRVSWQVDAARGTYETTYSWNLGGRQFPRWPRREREQTRSLYLTSSEERDAGINDSPAIRRRWVPVKGTYRIRPGERLVLYRREQPGGKVFESTIEAMVNTW